MEVSLTDFSKEFVQLGESEALFTVNVSADFSRVKIQEISLLLTNVVDESWTAYITLRSCAFTVSIISNFHR